MQIGIEEELQKIYDERSKWPEINKGLNYVIPKHEIHRRELVLLLEQILYQIEEARKEGDKNKECFNLDLCDLMKLAIE